MQTTRVPTNEEIRQEAIDNVPIHEFNVPGRKDMGLRMISAEYLKLQFRYFPLFCEETRRVNAIMLKELADVGYKSSTKYIAGKTYEGTSGWSKDKSFKFSWTVPQQLRTFMIHVYKDFWADSNSKVRNKFMKGIMKGEDPYTLLDEVYKYYGSNVVTAITQEDLK